MPNTTNSPNMGLPIPNVGQDPGPQFATDTNTCLTQIDQHNHSVGNGVPINANGINLTQDLPLNGNNLTNVRTTRYSPGAATSGTDRGCTYVQGADLFYNDTNGNIIRISSSGFLAASSGILPITGGGTGATTKLTAFNTLSPLTTKGDLIGFNGTDNIRVGVGSSGQVLTADSSQVAGWKWGTGINLILPTQQKFTASSTYTVPSNPSPTYAKVTIVGAGGGGGGGSNASGGGGAGGGGGGGTAIGWFSNAQLLGGVSMSIGLAGAAGVPQSSGSGGGATSFGSFLNAMGGGGGFTTASTQGVSGGIGGIATSGLNIQGNGGIAGTNGIAGVVGGAGGGGGGSYFCGGAPGATAQGSSGTSFGGGGAGGGGGQAGGPGAPGVIFVEEYYQ